MLYAGLDLSRKRLDFHLLDSEGATVEVGAAPPDGDGLLGLRRRLDRHREPIRAAIESMNGARFVHDQLELFGWQVEIADAQKVKGLAPLACKTDRIDAWVLAELARRDLVPAIWLPDPRVRAERERAHWRLHLVRHRSSLKQRVHAVLLTHGKPCPRKRVRVCLLPGQRTAQVPPPAERLPLVCCALVMTLQPERSWLRPTSARDGMPRLHSYPQHTDGWKRALGRPGRSPRFTGSGARRVDVLVEASLREAWVVDRR